MINELRFNAHPGGYTDLTVLTKGKGDDITFTTEWNKIWGGPDLHLIVPVGTDAIVFERYDHYADENSDGTRDIDISMFDAYRFMKNGERYALISGRCTSDSPEYEKIADDFAERIQNFLLQGYQKLEPKEIA